MRGAPRHLSANVTALPPGVRSVDRNLLCLPFNQLWRWQRYLEDSVLECRVALFFIDSFRQRNRPREPPVASFASVELVPVRFVLLGALAGNRQQSVVDLDVHILLPEAWQVGPHDELVPAPEGLYLRCPDALIDGR
jgi:hypothetical protein